MSLIRAVAIPIVTLSCVLPLDVRPASAATGRVPLAVEVVDSTGQALPGVTLALSQGDKRQAAVVTTGTGRFEFADIAPGAYVLEASISGFKADRREVAVSADAPSSVRFTLEPASRQETVVVIGKAPTRRSGHIESAAIPTSVDIVSADQIERENVGESLQVLRRVPGVYTADYNQGIISGDLGIRGFNTELEIAHTKLLIDGIPSNLNNGFNDLKPIFPLEIETVELVKGTNDARYGLHNIAGNLNVFTRHGGRYEKVKVLAGAFGTFDAQGVAALENGRISHTYFGGYRRADGYRDHSTQDKYSLSGKWFYASASKPFSLGLITRAFEFDGEAPGYLTEAEAEATPRLSPAFSSTDGGKQSNRHASLHLDYALRPDLAWSVKAYGQTLEKTRWVRFTAAGAQQERIEDETQYGAITSLTWRPRSARVQDLALSVGADFQGQDNVGQRFRAVERVRGTQLRDHDFDFSYAGAFVQTEGRPVEWLRLSGGLRVDQVGGTFTDKLATRTLDIIDYGTIWQPKVGAVVTPRQGYNLYANWGRSFQVGVGAGAYGQNLGYSTNDGWEAGVRMSPTGRLAMRASYWVQKASDEVRLKFDNSGDSENVGRTRRRGWDVGLTAELNKNIYLWGAFTTQEATLVEPGPREPQLKGKELHHVPEYAGKAGIDVMPTSKLTASLWCYGQDEYQLSNANTLGEYGGYWLANADVSYRLGKLTLGAHVKNLLDRDHHGTVWNDGTTTLFSPGDPRAVYVSLGADF